MDDQDGKIIDIFLKTENSGDLKKPSNSGAIIKWFEEVARHCEVKQQRRVHCATTAGAAHQTLCDIIVSRNLLPTAPLLVLRKQLDSVRQTQPVVNLFCDQWDRYQQLVYAANASIARAKTGIDPRWFDRQIAQVTFDTVFDNRLWEKTDGRKDQFDALDNNGEGKKRRAEEILAPEDRLDAPSSCFEVPNFL
jgi:hypothetical protein